MIKFNANPKGRKTGDCVIRAIAQATDKTWDEVYNDLCALGFKLKRMPNDKSTYEKYLELNGWVKQKQPRAYTYDGYKDKMSKFTIYEFLEDMNNNTTCYGGVHNIIISVANHLTMARFIDNKFQIIDTWDCGEKCVGNYWIKEGR